MLGRFLILLSVLVIGFGCVFVIPSSPEMAPTGIRLELPEVVGLWDGEDQEISAAELEDLAPDTQFARKIYRNAFGDEVLVSIVLSGSDMVNSIHRPERCLPAQGWTLERSEVLEISIAEAKKPLEVARLHTMRKAKLTNGEELTIYGYNYYWFVGYNDMTPSHAERNLYDIRDRIFYGYNQRWAYITVATSITDNLQKFGRDADETAAIIEELIQALIPYLELRPLQATPEKI